jgi:hypothetical protein
MSRGSGKLIVAAKKFKIRIANASAQQPDRCIAVRAARLAGVADGSEPFLKVNRNHQG